MRLVTIRGVAFPPTILRHLDETGEPRGHLIWQEPVHRAGEFDVALDVDPSLYRHATGAAEIHDCPAIVTVDGCGVCGTVDDAVSDYHGPLKVVRAVAHFEVAVHDHYGSLYHAVCGARLGIIGCVPFRAIDRVVVGAAGEFY